MKTDYDFPIEAILLNSIFTVHLTLAQSIIAHGMFLYADIKRSEAQAEQAKVEAEYQETIYKMFLSK